MKKVILLGDSIRLIGYGKRVEELLGCDYKVWQSDDNGRFAKYTLCNLKGWLANMPDADVIHWNNGFWDTCLKYEEDGSFTDIDTYLNDMKKIARELKKVTGNIIFATTTPVKPELPDQKNEIVNKYNDALVPELIKQEIKINDLNALVSKNVKEYICDDYCHLSDAGIEACAKKVVESIKSII